MATAHDDLDEHHGIAHTASVKVLLVEIVVCSGHDRCPQWIR